jgi:hypothetical protein
VRGLARHAVELFMSYSRRPVAAASRLSLAAAAAALAGAVAAVLAGSVAAIRPWAVPSAAVLLALALAAGLVSLSVVARYLLHVARPPGALPLFLVREANIPVRLEDRLAREGTGSAGDPEPGPQTVRERVS